MIPETDLQEGLLHGHDPEWIDVTDLLDLDKQQRRYICQALAGCCPKVKLVPTFTSPFIRGAV